MSASVGASSSHSGDKSSYSGIPSLKIELLSDNSKSYIPCIPNSLTPTPFETEFFKGSAMLMVRTDPVDEKFQSFFLRKRQFEVQVQGKFKRVPTGEVYVGAEVSKKMNLGTMTRFICNAGLALCHTMVRNMHYSYGDLPDHPTYQRPHIVAPMFPTFDKVLVTPPGQPVPPLGVPFKEDPEYRKQRVAFHSVFDAHIDLESTYSFSVNTPNVNIADWTLVEVPLTQPIGLKSLYGDGDIHLVSYEVPSSVAAAHPGVHPQRCINYLFNMKISHIPPDARESVTSASSDEVLYISARETTAAVAVADGVERFQCRIYGGEYKVSKSENW